MSHKATIINAPNEVPKDFRSNISIFLSGSIERGGGIDWRTRIAQELAQVPVVLLNPDRKDWDSTWKTSIDCIPFREQVTWELDKSEDASILAVYFARTTDAPITLLELGLHAKNGSRVVVCCPDGYSKKGNVQVVCQRYNIPLTETFDKFVEAILEKIQELRSD